MTIRPINPHARVLRQNQTDTEAGRWNQLRGRRLAGFKFKRQWTLGFFIADFCCIEQRLIVEVDGGQHSEAADASRTACLEERGYRVVRFWNHQVLANMDGVLQALLLELRVDPHPNPLPRAGEGV